MTENVIIAPEYKERAERVISEHMDLAWIANEGVRIAYLASDKEKKITAYHESGHVILFQLIKDYSSFFLLPGKNQGVCINACLQRGKTTGWEKRISRMRMF